jgi:hypothetical protein
LKIAIPKTKAPAGGEHGWGCRRIMALERTTIANVSSNPTTLNDCPSPVSYRKNIGHRNGPLGPSRRGGCVRDGSNGSNACVRAEVGPTRFCRRGVADAIREVGASSGPFVPASAGRPGDLCTMRVPAHRRRGSRKRRIVSRCDNIMCGAQIFLDSFLNRSGNGKA